MHYVFAFAPRCRLIYEIQRHLGMKVSLTLVTQPMLQRRPNRTELRLMDSYIQILWRFQKCKGKVPPS